MYRFIEDRIFSSDNVLHHANEFSWTRDLARSFSCAWFSIIGDKFFEIDSVIYDIQNRENDYSFDIYDIYIPINLCDLR